MTTDARIDLTDDYVLVARDIDPADAPPFAPEGTCYAWAVVRKADGHRMDNGTARTLAEAQDRAERNLRDILRRQKRRAGP